MSLWLKHKNKECGGECTYCKEVLMTKNNIYEIPAGYANRKARGNRPGKNIIPRRNGK